MTAYIFRRLLLFIPTLLGIMLVSFTIVQFAPGGPVERIIAQLTGTDVAATARIGGTQGGDFGTGSQSQTGGGADAVTSKYRGAQGLDPEFIKQLVWDSVPHESDFSVTNGLQINLTPY